LAETDVREPPQSVLDLPHRLSHLDQVTVGVAHVAADFLSAVDRRRQKLGSAGAPQLAHGADGGDWDVQKARHTTGIRGRSCRQGLQQRSIALDGLMNVQAPLNFPNTRRNRLHDRNTKILFEHGDDTERIPGGP
jgi:hypothetical protein